MDISSSNPPIIMRDTDVNSILSKGGTSNFLGKGAAGAVYRFDYYGIPAVVKIPVDTFKIDSLKKEIINYGYICKVFNECSCRENIVQMLGYDMINAIIMLENICFSTYFRHKTLPYTAAAVGGGIFDPKGFYVRVF